MEIPVLDNCPSCGMAYPTQKHATECKAPRARKELRAAEDRSKNLTLPLDTTEKRAA